MSLDMQRELDTTRKELRAACSTAEETAESMRRCAASS